jgi:hypothetical protein
MSIDFAVSLVVVPELSLRLGYVVVSTKDGKWSIRFLPMSEYSMSYPNGWNKVEDWGRVELIQNGDKTFAPATTTEYARNGAIKTEFVIDTTKHFLSVVFKLDWMNPSEYKQVENYIGGW